MFAKSIWSYVMNCWKLMMWNLQVLKWISSRAYVLSHRTFAPQPLFVFTLSEYSMKKSDARHLTCPLRNIKDLIATLQFDFETGRLLENIQHWISFMSQFFIIKWTSCTYCTCWYCNKHFLVFADEPMGLLILTTRSNHHNAISSVSEGIIFLYSTRLCVATFSKHKSIFPIFIH